MVNVEFSSMWPSMKSKEYPASEALSAMKQSSVSEPSGPWSKDTLRSAPTCIETHLVIATEGRYSSSAALKDERIEGNET